MQSRIILLITVLTVSLQAVQAQGMLKRLKDKAAQATESAVGTKISNSIDKTINGDSGSQANTTSQAPGSVAATDSHAQGNMPIKSFSRYDFVPGTNILYNEDFAQDVIGEFPLKWYTQSSGEVVTLENQQGKWLRMIPEGMYLSPAIALKDNYTIEFDLVLTTPVTGWLPGVFQFNLYDNGNGRLVLKSNEFRYNSMMSFVLQPLAKDSRTEFNTWENGKEKIHGARGMVTGYLEKKDQVVHIAINVQKERFRLWVGENKVYDIPEAVPVNTTFNQVRFSMGSTNYNKEQTGYFITNIKMASGVEDNRSKLITEGKLVTTGITFAVNSDIITPQSAPILKEIGTALKENEKVRIKITGHTDSDGADTDNLLLSKKRAVAVKKYLNTEFGIAEERMETDGKGEAEPVAKNTTAEGKANNRRVEFVKL